MPISGAYVRVTVDAITTGVTRPAKLEQDDVEAMSRFERYVGRKNNG